MTEPMLCPRREEAPHLASMFPGPDRYRRRGGLVGQKRACSYCGSMPPDAFMAALREGAEIEPTDKSYKAYLTTASGERGKFYYQHLSEEQRHEFLALLNERPRRFAIGYPGHFYVLPFFLAPA